MINNSEQHFAFRERLLIENPVNIVDKTVTPTENDYVFKDGLTIGGEDLDTVALTAANGFVNFLRDSLNISASFATENVTVSLKITEGNGYNIEISDNGIVILGNGRGIAQGIYHLENILKTRRAPFAEKGSISREPMFSPRMTHSGYALDDFPDVHLHQIARAGMDAVLYFTPDASDETVSKLNDLIARSAKYGIDVYLYSYILSKYHPDDPAAEAYYQSMYGVIFEKCKGLKGVILVGESCTFPSKDPDCEPGFYWQYYNTYSVPSNKPTSCDWPSCDYPEYLSFLKRIIHSKNPDVDIVFWTYNFGTAPEEATKKLIRSLPTDITLLVTFENWMDYPLEDVNAKVLDYTIAQVGPAQTFVEQAKIAKERGIKLYSMTNTGGRTWDISGAPYVPAPFQWIKRCEAVKEAQEMYGLRGLMESHHYGFYPSFISDLTREAFETGGTSLDNILRKYFGNAELDKIRRALKLFSDAIAYCTPTFEDQWGAFRTGPTYPFNLHFEMRIPDASPGLFNGGFYHPKYPVNNNGSKNHPCGIRIMPEIRSLEKMVDLLEQGQKILEAVEDKNDELLRLINMNRYIICCTVTGLNAKKWWLFTNKLKIEGNVDEAMRLIEQCEELLDCERLNAESAFEPVRRDSSLGYEAKMGYTCTEEQLVWKIKHLDYVKNVELRGYRSMLGGDYYYHLF